MKHVQALTLLLPASLLLGALPAKALDPSLINGSFENPAITNQLCTQFQLPQCYALLNESDVPGWETTATDSQIEIWTNGFLGVPAYEGSQFAELNATEESTLFQDVSGITAGNIVGYEFAHRGRNGTDTMSLTITDLTTSAVLFSSDFSTGNSDWAFYSSPNALVATGNTLRFAYAAVSSSGGNLKEGNLLDAVRFGVGVGAEPVPGPLPVLGAGSAFAFSRRLRRRLRGYRSPEA